MPNVQDQVSLGSTQDLSPLSRGNCSPICRVTKHLFTWSLHLCACVSSSTSLCSVWRKGWWRSKSSSTWLLVLQTVFFSPSDILRRPCRSGAGPAACWCARHLPDVLRPLYSGSDAPSLAGYQHSSWGRTRLPAGHVQARL